MHPCIPPFKVKMRGWLVFNRGRIQKYLQFTYELILQRISFGKIDTKNDPISYKQELITKSETLTPSLLGPLCRTSDEETFIYEFY